MGKMLGRQVSTTDGVGTAISVFTPFNGLYFEPEKSEITVWFGAVDNQNTFVSKKYHHSEIDAI